jgi:hypothetical protein
MKSHTALLNPSIGTLLFPSLAYLGEMFGSAMFDYDTRASVRVPEIDRTLFTHRITGSTLEAKFSVPGGQSCFLSLWDRPKARSAHERTPTATVAFPLIIGDEVARIRPLDPKNEILNLPLGEIVRTVHFLWHRRILQGWASRIENASESATDSRFGWNDGKEDS